MRLESIKVGRIVNAHGIHGEVRVQPRDGDPGFLTQFQTFYLDGKPMIPTTCRVHKSLVLMKFPGIDTMDDALALRNRDLFIKREDAHLSEGEFFDDELLGLDVFNADTDEFLGELVRVDSYPAHKVYTVRENNNKNIEYLIPAVPDVFIVSIQQEQNRMDVHIWEGMGSDAN